MPIMKIIQTLMMSFGSVQRVISIYITSINTTLREQARKHRKVMRCSEPKRKPWEILRNEVSAMFIHGHKSNSKWQAGGKARFIYLPPGYNNDPCIKIFLNVHVKSELIDLEAYEQAA
jgi:hypothetical protein